jgi:hypothetical protein
MSMVFSNIFKNKKTTIRGGVETLPDISKKTNKGVLNHNPLPENVLVEKPKITDPAMAVSSNNMSLLDVVAPEIIRDRYGLLKNKQRLFPHTFHFRISSLRISRMA